MAEVATAAVGPHDFDAEAAVLGTVLRGDARAFFEVAATGLRGVDFLRPSHQAVFAAVASLAGEGVVPDVVAVADALARTPAPDGHAAATMLDAVGGRERLEGIAGVDARQENASHYAGIVRECSLRRGLLVALGDAQRVAGSGAAFGAVLDGFERDAEELRARSLVERDLRSGAELVEAFAEKIANPPDEAALGVKAPYGLPWFRKGALETWTAYSGDGKTVGATDALAVACASGARVGYASLEMDGDAIVDRLVSKFGVPYAQVMSGRIEERFGDRVERAKQVIASWNFDVMDDEETDPAKLRRWAASGKYDLVIVDHMHCIDYDDRFDIERNVRRVRRMAKRLHIPVLMLVQLSRAGDKKNPYPRPTMAQLRETAVIEHESSRVAFLYRRRDEETGDVQRSTDFYYAKNRFGELSAGRRSLVFHGDNQMFKVP